MYVGFDPTAESLHLGHLVTLCTLLRFAQAGHPAMVLLGGATGLVGDPSWRNQQRDDPQPNNLNDNIAALQEQIGNFFTRHGQSVKLVNNLEWHGSFGLLDFLRTVGNRMRVSDLLGRDSVQSRLRQEEGLNYAELTYQLLQAYDFYHLYRHDNCRLQLGGSDQRGNMIAGLDLMRRMSPASRPEEDPPAAILTTPLLTTAGGTKMGKSAGNALWLNRRLTSPLDLHQVK